MDTRDVQQALLTTAWMGSWFARARPGDLTAVDLDARAAAWAHWAMESVTQMTGLYDRSYYALALPGQFYDPNGRGPQVRPHLEISSKVLDRGDAGFPDRLALAGNGLLFKWWVASEVVAVKRSMFNVRRGPLEPLLDVLTARRSSLQEALEVLMATAQPQWSTIEGLLVSSPDGLSHDAAGDFDVAEVADYFPAGRQLGLHVTYEPKLRAQNGTWASRRVGVWQLRGSAPNGRDFSTAVVTPRLTAGSLFKDPLFRPATESPAALLVRGLLLRRLVDRHLQADAVARVADRLDPAALQGPGAPHLRAVPAQPGQKLPQASMEAAVAFLQTFPEPDDAWAFLQTWIGDRYLLPVDQDAFAAAHRNAARRVRRAETPDRDDVDVILPLVWDASGGQSRLVRPTFVRPRT